MSNVQNINGCLDNSLVNTLQEAVEHAVSVPKPNKNTDLHLAVVPVGDLRKVITILRTIT